MIEISDFQLASATDRLGFYTAGFDLVQAGGTASTDTESAASLSVTLVSANSSATVSLGSAGSVVILRSGTFTDITDVITQMGSAGTHYLKVGTAMSAGAGDDLLVAWTDTAGDTYVTLLNGLSAMAGGSIFGNVQGTIEYDHLFKLNNVDIGSYSGAAFTDKFFTI